MEKTSSQTAPPPPKRPLNGYMRYRASVYQDIVKANPDKKMTELTKIVGAGWNKLDDAGKKVFNDPYKTENEKFKIVNIAFY